MHDDISDRNISFKKKHFYFFPNNSYISCEMFTFLMNGIQYLLRKNNYNLLSVFRNRATKFGF